MPDCAVGADVMVGFPGETDADFEESRQFIESLPFTYLHVFTYSERPGTPAAEMPDQVPMPVRKERNRILRELAARKNLEFRRAMVGRTLSVVTLHDPGTALSGNYLKVQLARPAEPNRLMDVEIGGVTESGIREQCPGDLFVISGRTLDTISRDGTQPQSILARPGRRAAVYPERRARRERPSGVRHRRRRQPRTMVAPDVSEAGRAMRGRMRRLRAHPASAPAPNRPRTPRPT